MTNGRLAGEVAIVTGSTSGLGRVVAELFAAEGALVLVTGRNEQRGADVVAGAPASMAFAAAELTDPSAADALVEAAVSRFGRLTVVVNNAVLSGMRDASVTNVDDAAWEQVIAVDLTAAMRLCRAAVPAIEDAGGGAIVNVSSRAAARGTPGHAAYTAAKGGLEALTRATAVDVAARGVRCNAVRPGYVLHADRDADLTEARREQLQAQQLLPLTTAHDVARVIAFLASREAAALTGLVVPVDGGSSAARAAVVG